MMDGIVAHIPHHALAMSLGFLVCCCSILYGLYTNEHMERMGIRGDVSPLYPLLGPSWGRAFVVLITSQWLCLTPGELVLSIVVIGNLGRLERVLGAIRCAAMVAVLFAARIAFMVAWCTLVLRVPLTEVRVRPSILWLTVSVYTLRICLIRSHAQILLGRLLPINGTPSFHVASWMLMLGTLKDSLWDTTVPSALLAGLMCTDMFGLHRWAWIDLAVQRWVRIVCKVQLRSTLRKTLSFPANNNSRSPVTATAPVPPVAEPAPPPPPPRAPRPHRPPRQQTLTPTAPEVALMAQLTQMGFPEDDARAALDSANNDPNVAVTLLLDGSVGRR